MIILRNVMVASLGLLSLSMGEVRHPVLLTPDYGILTSNDLEITVKNSHEECLTLGLDCPEYWVCLPIESFSLDCQLTDEEEQAFAPGIKMRAGGSSIEFFTRRPNDKEDCDETLDEWFDLLKDQEVACFMATYDPKRGEVPYNQSSFYLQLDRIKSRHGKWSYFRDEEWIPED